MRRTPLVVLLPAVVLFLVVVAGSAAVADEHHSNFGSVWIPDDLAPDAVVPVVILAGREREAMGRPPALAARGDVIVVEPVALQTRLGRSDSGGLVGKAVEAILRQADGHRDISACPWILVGFGDTAPHVAALALAEPLRFQGLVIANGSLSPRALVFDRRAARGLPVLVLATAGGEGASPVKAKALHAFLVGAGLDATLTTLETDEADAPILESGVAPIHAVLDKAAKREVPDRSRLRAWREMTTKGGDGLELTADAWDTGDPEAPIVVLFHQARSSRAEYRPIAGRLHELGFNALALDARSGAAWGGVLNETSARAAAQELGRDYADARVDLERALTWVRELGWKGKIFAWGSSYSAALVLGAQAWEGVDAVIAFSPGDYIEPRGSTLEAAATLQKPVLLVAPPREQKQARELLEKMPSTAKELYVHPGGLHGSRTLYASEHPDPAWARVEAFLQAHR